MANSSSSFTVSRDLQVVPPQAELGIVVPESQWNSLMDRIKKCGEPLDWHWAGGWAAIGVAISSAASAVSIYASVELVKTSQDAGVTRQLANWPATIALIVFIVATVAGFAIAGCALYYCILAKQHGETLRRVIVEDMEALAKVQRAAQDQPSQLPREGERIITPAMARLLNKHGGGFFGGLPNS